jgi:hypothetical protein
MPKLGADGLGAVRIVKPFERLDHLHRKERSRWNEPPSGVFVAGRLRHAGHGRKAMSDVFIVGKWRDAATKAAC